MLRVHFTGTLKLIRARKQEVKGSRQSRIIAYSEKQEDSQEYEIGNGQRRKII